MLVSCIMPTYNRREFIPHAIRYFMRQSYPEKELIIIDDGSDQVADLIPDDPRINYYLLKEKHNLGAKLNIACRYANGEIIANWDDDDWYDERRLEYQVSTLSQTAAELCGINQLYYFEPSNQHAYQYCYPAEQRMWLLGSSLCYYKSLWLSNPFAEIDVGMDALFVWATPAHKVKALTDATFAVHLIHDQNASKKQTTGSWWHKEELETIKNLMKDDWQYYQNGHVKQLVSNPYSLSSVPCKPDTPRALKNIYACLVHENEECIIDLVRNLRYHDPESPILLYNGGHHADLFGSAFPYHQFGVFFHPHPQEVFHGYLHTYALNCMEYALKCFDFECMTIVDSDQLAIRPGYTRFLKQTLGQHPNAGLLSNRPDRLTALNREVWTSIKAFEEYELWKPLLQSFPQGEQKFVHWTFWPSTVIFKEAMTPLLKLFNENIQLKAIMQQTRIWATEEIILPTLISLLGFDIVQNTCSDTYVQYRKDYTADDAAAAMNISGAYWMHPINRVYNDSARKFIRDEFHYYVNPEQKKDFTHLKSTGMLTLPLLNRIKAIDGWLEDQEADLLMVTALKACIDIPPPHHIVEIGSYHGKSTVVLGNVVKHFFPSARVYAIDPHEGNVGASDQGISILAPSLQKFKQHMAEEDLQPYVEIIQDYSFQVKWDEQINLLFIDGLHDYYNVSRDFWHFSPWVKSGGYIAFHDYADYYPGVIAFVDELLISGAYRKFNLAKSMIVIQKI